MEVEKEWQKAQNKLRQTERLKQEAANNLRKQEEARDANTRAMKLLPELRESVRLITDAEAELGRLVQACSWDSDCGGLWSDIVAPNVDWHASVGAINATALLVE